MVKKVLFFLAVVLVLCLGSCDIFDKVSSSYVANLVLHNNSSETIVAVYATPSTWSSWGSNLLDGDLIGPGESKTLEFITSGGTDCSAESATNYWVIWGAPVLNEGITITWTSPKPPQLQFLNVLWPQSEYLV